MTMTACAASPDATTMDEVVARVREYARPLAPERVPLALASGRVLRESVVASEDQPPFDRSAMDGYAVRQDDDSTAFRIVDRIRAGEWKPRELQRGEAVQIATGAPLPGAGLQVIIKEEADVEGDRVMVRRRDAAGFIRFRGEDARAGQVLVEPGVRLAPGALALLAGLGRAEPLVSRLPRVLHLATGNEIVSPDETPAAGQIRDSNSTLVRAFLGQWGVVPGQFRVPEDSEAAKAAIPSPESEAPPFDLLLISGGVSVGAHDFTGPLLEELGFTLHVRRTTTRPGKPLIFGARDGALAFGLPGNPLAHFVCLNLYVRQALWRFSGATQAPDFQAGVLAADAPVEANERETLWPARMELVEGEARLKLLRWRSSGDLTSLATANALVRVPSRSASLSSGGTVQFLATSADLP